MELKLIIEDWNMSSDFCLNRTFYGIETHQK